MALKIRLRQQGQRNRKVYRFVVADARCPREGRYIECLGWYNPFAVGSQLEFVLSEEKTLYWLEKGAQPTESFLNFLNKSAPAAVQLLEARRSLRARKRKEERRRSATRRKAGA
ncbi:30S ribosomal protein S16 [Candidatus Similichlamydia laticola]|uniref:Small ribosomal subunit protein bS16 n=1 Tax=Candidatus Similichlamydia laticola TaxID=2170265 RepID=A0A369K9Y2_9BACT|nr:30S ribosomal protein S16 [Candidatus Similichlamydia laticola]RDB31409.1 SSU ribosomal protein S16p [Candidatus Similichlamydia laticola]